MKSPENPKVLVAGDWHGSAGQAIRVIEHAIDQNIDTIVQVGDFGIWRGDERFLNKVQAKLYANDVQLYFIDGNHEDFPRLYAYPEEQDGTRKIRSNITHLPRGFRWKWNGINFLAVGGAASIDKKYREPGKTWWSEELLTDADIAKSQDGGPVDVMFAHDSPATAPNSITDDPAGQLRAGMSFGFDNLEICTSHRLRLQEITDVVKPVILFHGHYHKAMSGEYKHNGSEEINYVFGLDEGAAKLPQHIMVLDLEEVALELIFRNNGVDASPE